MRKNKIKPIIRGQIDIGAFNIAQFMDGIIHISTHLGESMEVSQKNFEKAIADFYDKYF